MRLRYLQVLPVQLQVPEDQCQRHWPRPSVNGARVSLSVKNGLEVEFKRRATGSK